MCPPQKSYDETPRHLQCDGIRRLGLWDYCPYKERACFLPRLSTMRGYKKLVCDWERGRPRTWKCWNPDNRRPASRTLRNAFVRISHPVRGLVSHQPRLVKTLSSYSFLSRNGTRNETTNQHSGLPGLSPGHPQLLDLPGILLECQVLDSLYPPSPMLPSTWNRSRCQVDG